MKNRIFTFFTAIGILLLLVFTANPLLAQDLNMDLLKGIEPRNVGPAGMSGRITAIDVVQSDNNIIYVGAASGGVWKSENAGVTWEPIFEDQGPMAIGALDIYQKNPSIIGWEPVKVTQETAKAVELEYIEVSMAVNPGNLWGLKKPGIFTEYSFTQTIPIRYM